MKKDDPHEMSKHLIAQHGSPKSALNAAIDGAADAQAKEDLYALSVWRDVKRILRAQIDE